MLFRSVFNETRQILFHHELMRKNIRSVVMGEKNLTDIATKHSSDEFNNDYLYKPCALIEINTNQPIGTNTDDLELVWQDMGEIKTESINVFSVLAGKNKGYFLLYTEKTGKTELKKEAESYCEGLVRDIRRQFSAEASYTVKLHKGIHEIVLDKSDLESLHTADETVVTAQIIKYLNEHYMDEITLEKVSEIFHVSRYYISRNFKNETGENFIGYLNHIRINKAKGLIRENKYNINEISAMTGFLSASYFCIVFKNITKMTPREYYLSKFN